MPNSRSRPPRITAPPPEFAGAVVTSEPRQHSAPDLEEIVEDLTDDAILEESTLSGRPLAAATPSLAPVEPGPVPPPAEPIPTPRLVAKGPKPDSLTLLVVEDDEAIRTMICRALGTQYNVYEAFDGQNASDVLDLIPAPACIVSDVMMPRLDGIGLAKKVKATPSLKWTPIIFLTAKNSTLDVVQGINAGARHYISKPFKMKELLEKVATVIKPGPKA